MPAGITAHPIAVELLVKLAFLHVLVDDIAERGQTERASSSIF
jgi:hypothetical protein